MFNAVDYNFIKLDELYSQPLEINWLIEDVIPSNSIGMIYGYTMLYLNSFKTA